MTNRLLKFRSADRFEQVRERLVAETSAWLTYHLEHPELAVRIPVIPAGSGRFPPSLTDAFWGPVLAE